MMRCEFGVFRVHTPLKLDASNLTAGEGREISCSSPWSLGRSPCERKLGRRFSPVGVTEKGGIVMGIGARVWSWVCSAYGDL